MEDAEAGRLTRSGACNCRYGSSSAKNALIDRTGDTYEPAVFIAATALGGGPIELSHFRDQTDNRGRNKGRKIAYYCRIIHKWTIFLQNTVTGKWGHRLDVLASKE